MKLFRRRVVYPLLRPLKVGGTVLHERAVIELKLEDRSARPGFGEASPLPGLHRETVDEVAALLPRARAILGEHSLADSGGLIALARDDRWLELPPSLRCGLEAAAWQCSGHATAGDGGLLFATPPSVAPPTSALVDRDLADLDPAVAAHRCVKIKVGRRAVHLEIAMVQALRRVLGDDAELRLDANRAFSLEAALEFAAEVASARPVWIEEPLHDPEELPLFVQRSGLGVALDETLHESGRGAVSRSDGIVAWVLKPALLGFVHTADFFARALTAPNRPCCVVSSSFEGHLGLEALQCLANHAPGLPAPGLGTAEWLGPPSIEPWSDVHEPG